MDKVKITREQADAIRYALDIFPAYKDRKDALLGGHWICITSGDNEVWAEELTPLNELTFDQLAVALYVGYEVEETPEDKVREYYNSMRNDIGPIVIKHTLDLLNIKIVGVNHD